MDYWTEEEIKALDTVTSFEELGDVAVAILKRMHETGKEIVQLCGPMTTGGFNDISKNFLFFGKAIEVAQSHGDLVFNQLPFQHAMARLDQNIDKKEAYCMSILEIFYRKIFESEYVKITYFLPDWRSSRGATWEYNLIATLPIEVRDFPQEWVEEALQKMAA